MKKEKLQCNTVGERFVCTVSKGMLHPCTALHYIISCIFSSTLHRWWDILQDWTFSRLVRRDAILLQTRLNLREKLILMDKPNYR